jgi:hypothetical protein
MVRDRRASDCALRFKPARGRWRKVRHRGYEASRSGGESGRNRRAISRRYGVRARNAGRVRCGDCALSRCRDDSDQGCVVRKRREHHARTSIPAHVPGSWHRDGHRRPGPRRSIQHDCGYGSVFVVCTSRSPVRRSPIVWRSTDRLSILRPSISRTVKIAPPAMTRSPTTGRRPSTPKT